MSAPHTNIEKQKRRHKGPLIGMGIAVLFVGVIIVYWTNQKPPADQLPGAEGSNDRTGSAADSDAPSVPAAETVPTVSVNSTAAP